MIRTRYFVLSSTLICLLSVFVTAIVYSSSSTSIFYISSGLYPGAPTYTIWIDDVTYYTKDANGKIAFSGTNLLTDVLSNLVVVGSKIYFSTGIFEFTDTWIISVHGFTIEGSGSDLSAAGGTIFQYSGTGTPINVYLAANRIQKFTLRSVNIVAQGDAVTSTGAKGIWLVNTEDALIDRVTVRDFEAGTGISITCDSSQYSAQTVIRESFQFENKYGIN